MQFTVRRARIIGSFESAGGIVGTGAAVSVGIPAVLRAAGTATGVTTFTTDTDAPGGSLIVLMISAWVIPSVDFSTPSPGVTDSAGNTYTFAVQDFVDWTVSFFYRLSATHLPAGGTIDVSGFGQTTRTQGVFVSSANGGLDQTAHFGTGAHVNSFNSGSGFSTPALSTSNQIVFAAQNNGLGTGGWNEDATFTALGAAGILPYRKVNSSSAVNWNPSWTNGTDISAVLATFKAG